MPHLKPRTRIKPPLLAAFLLALAWPGSVNAQNTVRANTTDPNGHWSVSMYCGEKRYSVSISGLVKVGEERYEGAISTTRINAKNMVIDWQNGGIVDSGTVRFTLPAGARDATLEVTGIEAWKGGSRVDIAGSFDASYDTFVKTADPSNCSWTRFKRSHRYAPLQYNPFAMAPALRTELDDLQGDWDQKPKNRRPTIARLRELSIKADPYFDDLRATPERKGFKGDTRIARYVQQAHEAAGDMEAVGRWRTHWLFAAIKEGGLVGDFAAVQWFYILLADTYLRDPKVFEQALELMDRDPGQGGGKRRSAALAHLESGVDVAARGNMAQTGQLLSRAAAAYAKKLRSKGGGTGFSAGLTTALLHWRQGGAAELETVLERLAAELPRDASTIPAGQLAAYHALKTAHAVAELRFRTAARHFASANQFLEEASISGNTLDPGFAAVNLLWNVASDAVRRQDCAACFEALQPSIAAFARLISAKERLERFRGHAFLLMRQLPKGALSDSERKAIDRAVFQENASDRFRRAKHSSMAAALDRMIGVGTKPLMSLLTARKRGQANAAIRKTLDKFISFQGEFGDYIGTLRDVVAFATALGDNGYTLAEEAALARMAGFWSFGYDKKRRKPDPAIAANLAPLLAPGLVRLAELRARGRPLAAYPPGLRLAADMVTSKLAREWQIGSDRTVSVLRSLKPTAQKAARLLLTAKPRRAALRTKMRETGFQLLQIAALSDTAVSVQIARRKKVIQQQGVGSLVQDRRQLLRDAKLYEAAARQQKWMFRPIGAERAAAKARADLAKLDGRLGDKSANLDGSVLAGGRTLSMKKLARELKAGDLLLLIQAEADATLVVTLDSRARLKVRKSPLGRAALEERVAEIRQGLSLSQGRFPPFPVGAAHDLYVKLFGPMAKSIAKAKRVVSIVSGPLQALPLGVLVTRKPKTKTLTVEQAGTTRIAWFAASTAETRTPGLQAFLALSRNAAKPKRQLSFLGIGDPVLAPTGRRRRNVSVEDLTQSGRGVDVDLLRSLASLPETADELRRLSTIVAGEGGRVVLQDQANESFVKAEKLDGYDVLAFATHGVVAGAVFEESEPGLVLTPPATGSREDDGFLSMSEVARLKLDARLVILSACDTATSDGRPLADGLSGLARAFFSAGAQNIVATHWPIPSLPSVEVTTRMMQAFGGQGARDGSWAEALRKAQIALMSTKIGSPEFAHPASWGAFQVIGGR